MFYRFRMFSILDQRLGTVGFEVYNTKLKPMEHQNWKKDTKKPRGVGNGQQVVKDENKIPFLYQKMLKTIKTVPLSAQSRLKSVIKRLVTKEERIVHVYEQDANNKDYTDFFKGVRPNSKESENKVSEGTKIHTNSSKGLRPNSKESEKKDNKKIKSHTNSSKGVRPNSKESGKKYNKKIKIHTNSSQGVLPKVEHNKGTISRKNIKLPLNSSESKYKDYNNGTSEDIHANKEESENEKMKYDGFGRNEPPNKETNNGSSPIDEKPPSKDSRGEDYKALKPKNVTPQTEYINRTNTSVQKEIPHVDVKFPPIVGASIHNKTTKVDYAQEANTEFQPKNIESKIKSGETSTKRPLNKKTGEGLLPLNKELETTDKNETTEGSLNKERKIEQNKNITEAIKNIDESQQTNNSTKPSDIIQTSKYQSINDKLTVVSDSSRHVNKTNKLKMIQGIFQHITRL